MDSPDVAVIGAGPAGLVAAASAARRGRTVKLLERNDRPGRKLLLTGGGRCNLLDPSAPALDALDAFGRPGQFLRDALARFDWSGFLADLAVDLERDDADGRFTVKGGARRMLDALLEACERAGVEIVTGGRVAGLTVSPAGGFEVALDGGEVVHAGRVVVATGGLTWSDTGSTGDAFAWARALGHAVDEPRGALGALVTEPDFAALAGVSVPDVALTLRVDGKRAAQLRGDVLFTHRGLSGPAALDLSLELVRARTGASAEITLDFLPDVERRELERRLASRRGRQAAHVFQNERIGRRLAGRLIRELLARADVDPARSVEQVPHAKLRAFAESL